MTNSNQILTKPLLSKHDSGGRLSRPDILAGLTALLSFFGFLDAGYLTAEHYFTLPLPCSLTHGCDTVLTSPYATFMGVPVALFGVLYYLTILFCAVYFYTSEKHHGFVARLIFALVCLAFLLYLLFIYLQIFVIHALCVYCLGSAMITFLLFILSISLMRSMRGTD